MSQKTYNTNSTAYENNASNVDNQAVANQTIVAVCGKEFYDKVKAAISRGENTDRLVKSETTKAITSAYGGKIPTDSIKNLNKGLKYLPELVGVLKKAASATGVDPSVLDSAQAVLDSDLYKVVQSSVSTPISSDVLEKFNPAESVSDQYINIYDSAVKVMENLNKNTPVATKHLFYLTTALNPQLRDFTKQYSMIYDAQHRELSKLIPHYETLKEILDAGRVGDKYLIQYLTILSLIEAVSKSNQKEQYIPGTSINMFKQHSDDYNDAIIFRHVVSELDEIPQLLNLLSNDIMKNKSQYKSQDYKNLSILRYILQSFASSPYKPFTKNYIRRDLEGNAIIGNMLEKGIARLNLAEINNKYVLAVVERLSKVANIFNSKYDISSRTINPNEIHIKNKVISYLNVEYDNTIFMNEVNKFSDVVDELNASLNYVEIGRDKQQNDFVRKQYINNAISYKNGIDKKLIDKGNISLIGAVLKYIFGDYSTTDAQIITKLNDLVMNNKLDRSEADRIINATAISDADADLIKSYAIILINIDSIMVNHVFDKLTKPERANAYLSKNKGVLTTYLGGGNKGDIVLQIKELLDFFFKLNHEQSFLADNSIDRTSIFAKKIIEIYEKYYPILYAYSSIDGFDASKYYGGNNSQSGEQKQLNNKCSQFTKLLNEKLQLFKDNSNVSTVLSNLANLKTCAELVSSNRSKFDQNVINACEKDLDTAIKYLSMLNGNNVQFLYYALVDLYHRSCYLKFVDEEKQKNYKNAVEEAVEKHNRLVSASGKTLVHANLFKSAVNDINNTQSKNNNLKNIKDSYKNKGVETDRFIESYNANNKSVVQNSGFDQTITDAVASGAAALGCLTTMFGDKVVNIQSDSTNNLYNNIVSFDDKIRVRNYVDTLDSLGPEAKKLVINMSENNVVRDSYNDDYDPYDLDEKDDELDEYGEYVERYTQLNVKDNVLDNPVFLLLIKPILGRIFEIINNDSSILKMDDFLSSHLIRSNMFGGNNTNTKIDVNHIGTYLSTILLVEFLAKILEKSGVNLADILYSDGSSTLDETWKRLFVGVNNTIKYNLKYEKSQLNDIIGNINKLLETSQGSELVVGCVSFFKNTIVESIHKSIKATKVVQAPHYTANTLSTLLPLGEHESNENFSFATIDVLSDDFINQNAIISNILLKVQNNFVGVVKDALGNIEIKNEFGDDYGQFKFLSSLEKATEHISKTESPNDQDELRSKLQNFLNNIEQIYASTNSTKTIQSIHLDSVKHVKELLEFLTNDNVSNLLNTYKRFSSSDIDSVCINLYKIIEYIEDSTKSVDGIVSAEANNIAKSIPFDKTKSLEQNIYDFIYQNFGHLSEYQRNKDVLDRIGALAPPVQQGRRGQQQQNVPQYLQAIRSVSDSESSKNANKYISQLITANGNPLNILIRAITDNAGNTTLNGPFVEMIKKIVGNRARSHDGFNLYDLSESFKRSLGSLSELYNIHSNKLPADIVNSFIDSDSFVAEIDKIKMDLVYLEQLVSEKSLDNFVSERIAFEIMESLRRNIMLYDNNGERLGFNNFGVTQRQNALPLPLPQLNQNTMNDMAVNTSIHDSLANLIKTVNDVYFSSLKFAEVFKLNEIMDCFISLTGTVYDIKMQNGTSVIIPKFDEYIARFVNNVSFEDEKSSDSFKSLISSIRSCNVEKFSSNINILSKILLSRNYILNSEQQTINGAIFSKNNNIYTMDSSSDGRFAFGVREAFVVGKMLEIVTNNISSKEIFDVIKQIVTTGEYKMIYSEASLNNIIIGNNVSKSLKESFTTINNTSAKFISPLNESLLLPGSLLSELIKNSDNYNKMLTTKEKNLVSDMSPVSIIENIVPLYLLFTTMLKRIETIDILHNISENTENKHNSIYNSGIITDVNTRIHILTKQALTGSITDAEKQKLVLLNSMRYLLITNSVIPTYLQYRSSTSRIIVSLKNFLSVSLRHLETFLREKLTERDIVSNIKLSNNIIKSLYIKSLVNPDVYLPKNIYVYDSGQDNELLSMYSIMALTIDNNYVNNYLDKYPHNKSMINIILNVIKPIMNVTASSYHTNGVLPLVNPDDYDSYVNNTSTATVDMRNLILYYNMKALGFDFKKLQLTDYIPLFYNIRKYNQYYNTQAEFKLSKMLADRVITDSNYMDLANIYNNSKNNYTPQLPLKFDSVGEIELDKLRNFVKLHIAGFLKNPMSVYNRDNEDMNNIVNQLVNGSNILKQNFIYKERYVTASDNHFKLADIASLFIKIDKVYPSLITSNTLKGIIDNTSSSKNNMSASNIIFRGVKAVKDSLTRYMQIAKNRPQNNDRRILALMSVQKTLLEEIGKGDIINEYNLIMSSLGNKLSGEIASQAAGPGATIAQKLNFYTFDAVANYDKIRMADNALNASIDELCNNMKSLANIVNSTDIYIKINKLLGAMYELTLLENQENDLVKKLLEQTSQILEAYVNKLAITNNTSNLDPLIVQNYNNDFGKRDYDSTYETLLKASNVVIVGVSLFGNVSSFKELAIKLKSYSNMDEFKRALLPLKNRGYIKFNNNEIIIPEEYHQYIYENINDLTNMVSRQLYDVEHNNEFDNNIVKYDKNNINKYTKQELDLSSVAKHHKEIHNVVKYLYEAKMLDYIIKNKGERFCESFNLINLIPLLSADFDTAFGKLVKIADVYTLGGTFDITKYTSPAINHYNDNEPFMARGSIFKRAKDLAIYYSADRAAANAADNGLAALFPGVQLPAGALLQIPAQNAGRPTDAWINNAANVITNNINTYGLNEDIILNSVAGYFDGIIGVQNARQQNPNIPIPSVKVRTVIGKNIGELYKILVLPKREIDDYNKVFNYYMSKYMFAACCEIANVRFDAGNGQPDAQQFKSYFDFATTNLKKQISSIVSDYNTSRSFKLNEDDLKYQSEYFNQTNVTKYKNLFVKTVNLVVAKYEEILNKNKNAIANINNGMPVPINHLSWNDLRAALVVANLPTKDLDDFKAMYDVLGLKHYSSIPNTVVINNNIRVVNYLHDKDWSTNVSDDVLKIEGLKYCMLLYNSASKNDKTPSVIALNKLHNMDVVEQICLSFSPYLYGINIMDSSTQLSLKEKAIIKLNMISDDNLTVFNEAEYFTPELLDSLVGTYKNENAKTNQIIKVLKSNSTSKNDDTLAYHSLVCSLIKSISNKNDYTLSGKTYNTSQMQMQMGGSVVTPDVIKTTLSKWMELNKILIKDSLALGLLNSAKSNLGTRLVRPVNDFGF
jgi:hypothetical protein